MDEKFIMMDVLATEKWMTVSTATALNEASCDAVYDVYADLFNDLSSACQDVFTICFNHSWYQLEAAPQPKLKQDISKLCGELNQDE